MVSEPLLQAAILTTSMYVLRYPLQSALCLPTRVIAVHCPAGAKEEARPLPSGLQGRREFWPH